MIQKYLKNVNNAKIMPSNKIGNYITTETEVIKFNNLYLFFIKYYEIINS